MPYIHVTTSAILPILTFTNFELIPIKTLLLEYKLAPFSGEVHQGGLVGATRNDGPVAFALLNNDGTWSIKSLLNNYGQIVWKANIKNNKDYMKIVFNMCNYYFQSILPKMIELVRHNQMNMLPKLSPSEIAELDLLIEQTFKNVKQMWTANFIFSRYFYFDKLCLEDISFLTDFYKEIPEDFLERDQQSQREWLENIDSKPISCKFIPESNNNNLNQSDKIIKKSGYFYELDTSLLYPERNDFLYQIAASYQPNNFDNFDEYISYRQYFATKHFDKIKTSIDELQKTLDLLRQIIHGELNPLEVEMQTQLQATSYPLVFLLDDDKKLENVKYEYRAKSPLKIGEDIKRIYTDKAHIKNVDEFFKKNNLIVEVKDIDSLCNNEVSLDNTFSIWQQPKNSEPSNELVKSLTHGMNY